MKPTYVERLDGKKWGKAPTIKKEIEDQKRKKHGQSGCTTHRNVENTDGFVLLSIRELRRQEI